VDDLSLNPEPTNVSVELQAGWYAENLRVTIFVTPGLVQRPLFAEIVGVAPAEITARPQLQVHQEFGIALGGHVVVAQQPGRIDVVLSGAPVNPGHELIRSDGAAFFWIGTLAESMTAFDSAVNNTVTLVGSATRAAFAITVLRQADTKPAAMATLRKYLPTIDFDPETDLDISFQINRPRTIDQGHRINRLARWDIIESRLIRLAPEIAKPSFAFPATAPSIAARAYIDVSTDADDPRQIAANDLSHIISKLRSFAVELAEQGDMK
jgi:hypothetical protein